MSNIKKVKASTIPIASSIQGFNAFGIKKNADGSVDNVQVPMNMLLTAVPVLSARIEDRGHLMVVTNEQI